MGNNCGIHAGALFLIVGIQIQSLNSICMSPFQIPIAFSLFLPYSLFISARHPLASPTVVAGRSPLFPRCSLERSGPDSRPS
jgi:hypothetical protein